ncbi:membrane protein [Formosa sp. Hel1_33_131]|jgi:hypothetical protein|uniref:DUF6095 family protein n=1 Tax=Formosa sp. Hel1_33_131 TaxID=1336794 RepID=UPI00084E1100|nr:DUF6095 family protein [Formosa sp. Hel1_33_131]AOR27482.1 membrane protein [Formosa sp. Hel1_33_131]
METPRTNKDLLVGGLKTMGVTLFLLFLGPFILHAGFSNPDKPLYIPLVIAGVLTCGAAIYFGFKGIRTIMDSLFGRK